MAEEDDFFKDWRVAFSCIVQHRACVFTVRTSTIPGTCWVELSAWALSISRQVLKRSLFPRSGDWQVVESRLIDVFNVFKRFLSTYKVTRAFLFCCFAIFRPGLWCFGCGLAIWSGSHGCSAGVRMDKKHGGGGLEDLGQAIDQKVKGILGRFGRFVPFLWTQMTVCVVGRTSLFGGGNADDRLWGTQSGFELDERAIEKNIARCTRSEMHAHLRPRCWPTKCKRRKAKLCTATEPTQRVRSKLLVGTPLQSQHRAMPSVIAGNSGRASWKSLGHDSGWAKSNRACFKALSSGRMK